MRETKCAEDKGSAYIDIWAGQHVNARYAQLIPLLRGVRIFRLGHNIDSRLGGAFYRKAVTPAMPYAVKALAAVFQRLFTTNLKQIEHFTGRVVIDVDDPSFSASEVKRLNHPNVDLVIFTSRKAQHKMELRGLTRPSAVLRHGTRPTSLRGAEYPRFTVAYMAAFLTLSGDSGSHDPMYNLDHLVEKLWPAISEMTDARLLLLGRPGRRMAAWAAGQQSVVVTGRLPHADALRALTQAHVGLYPRQADQEHQSMKIYDYVSAGLPTVAYDVEDAGLVKSVPFGLAVNSPTEFIESVSRLHQNSVLRLRFRERAREYALQNTWSNRGRELNRLLRQAWPSLC